MLNMSFLRLVLSVSIFCYSQARSIRSVENDQPSYDLDAIVKDLTDCFDQKLEPLLSQLNNDNQNSIRDLALSGIASYVQNMANYINDKAEYDDTDYYEGYYDDAMATIEITDVFNPPSAEDDTNSTETTNTENVDSTATAESTAVSSSSS